MSIFCVCSGGELVPVLLQQPWSQSLGADCDLCKPVIWPGSHFTPDPQENSHFNVNIVPKTLNLKKKLTKIFWTKLAFLKIFCGKYQFFGNFLAFKWKFSGESHRVILHLKKLTKREITQKIK